MKDLLVKENYCYKIHTLLIKSSAHPPPPPSLSLFFLQTIPLIWANLLFHKKIFIPNSMIFQKSQPSINKGGSSLVPVT